MAVQGVPLEKSHLNANERSVSAPAPLMNGMRASSGNTTQQQQQPAGFLGSNARIACAASCSRLNLES
ncbi:unnamed protein product [Lampetra planeri]